MQRREDWLERLHEELEAAADRVFAWGGHDCARFAARCVDAMCGSAFEVALGERYSDEDSARAWLASADFAELVTEHIGAPMPNPRFAQPGDVVLWVNDRGEPTLGIIVGHHVVAAAPRGFVGARTDTITHAWAVGR